MRHPWLGQFVDQVDIEQVEPLSLSQLREEVMASLRFVPDGPPRVYIRVVSAPSTGSKFAVAWQLGVQAAQRAREAHQPAAVTEAETAEQQAARAAGSQAAARGGQQQQAMRVAGVVHGRS